MVEDAGDQRFEDSRHGSDGLGKHLVDEDVAEHQTYPQHDRYVKHHHEVVDGEEAEQAGEGVAGEFAGTEEIAECHQVYVVHDGGNEESAEGLECCHRNGFIEVCE